MLEVTGARKHFGGVKALDGVAVTVAAARVHALLGENGAGKSTLLKCLSGGHRLDEGTMRLAGEEYRPRGPHDAEAAGLRFVHQELNLVPGFTAVENAFVGRRYPRRHGMIDWAGMRRRMADTRDRLGLELPLDVPVRRLSIGQQQLVEILRALMDEARILVLDEPTSSLSEAEARRLLALTRDLANGGHAVIFVSHRMDEVFEVADDYTVLRNGRSVAGGRLEGTNHDEIVALMAGGELSHARKPESSAPGRTVLSVSDLACTPWRKPFELTVGEGEIVGLYGMIGSGRSSLLKTVWGANPRAQGKIVFCGAALPAVGIGERIRAGMVYVPEDRRREGLIMNHSVLDNAALPRLREFRAISGLPVVSRLKMRRRIRAVLKRFKVKFGRLSDRVSTLSGGNQQKILIGRWLDRETRLVLLDEPTRGVDVRSKGEIHDLCRRLATDGAAVIFATSDIDELMMLATRIVVMAHGGLSIDKPAAAIDRRAVLDAAFRTTDMLSTGRAA